MRNLIISTLIATIASQATGQINHNPATDWMAKAKLGAFMHFLPGTQNFANIDAFDVDALINQLVDANADYFGFTLGQNSGYYNAPNPVFDELTGYKPGEHCSKRDLPMEIAKACKKHGIKFILYLPCQPANRDAHAEEAIGFPATPPNSDRHFTMPGAQNWAKVIEYWAKHYGDLVDGWWFDGGYEWIGFRDKHAQLYSQAVKSGNPNAVATFNPGVRLVRATQFEDYTAGEINDPFTVRVEGRWTDGSQNHILTFMGSMWGRPDCRFKDEQWIPWLKATTAAGCPVTIDMGIYASPESAAPMGTFMPEQIKQFKRLRKALD